MPRPPGGPGYVKLALRELSAQGDAIVLKFKTCSIIFAKIPIIFCIFSLIIFVFYRKLDPATGLTRS